MYKYAFLLGAWLGLPISYLIVGSGAVSFGFAMGASMMAIVQAFTSGNGND